MIIGAWGLSYWHLTKVTVTMTGSDVPAYISVNPIYARLTLQITYFFGKHGNRFRPKVFLGPSVAFKLDELYHSNGNSWRAGSTTYAPERFKSLDAGVIGGGGLNVYEGGRTWLSVDLSYYQGFTPALNAQLFSGDNCNRNLRLNVSLMWGL